MTAKHTPGPWNCIEQSHGTYIYYTDADDAEWNIATMEPGRGNILDDARLIAAAPELLVNERANDYALETAERVLAEHGIELKEITKQRGRNRAAIAKAEGREV